MKSYQGLFIWIITTLFVVYGACLNIAAAALADEIKLTLHLSNPEISVAIASYIMGYGLTQIPAGYLIDRYNVHFLMCGAITLTLIGNLALPHAPNIWFFCAANFLQGMGASFAFIASGILITEWFTPQSFPILVGLLETIVTLSIAILEFLFVVTAEQYNWKMVYYILALLGGFLWFSILLFVKSPPHFNKPKPISVSYSFKKVIYNKQIWLCSIAAGFSFGVLLAYADLWFVPVQKFYLVEHRETALIGSFFYLGITIGGPLLSWLSNKFNSRKLILHVSLVLGNMALLLAIYLPHFAIETLIIAKITSFLTGFFLSGSILFYTVVKENAAHETYGVALALANTIVNIFNSIMLLIPYLFLTASSKEFFTYLWVLPFCVLIAILLNYFIRDGIKPIRAH